MQNGDVAKWIKIEDEKEVLEAIVDDEMEKDWWSEREACVFPFVTKDVEMTPVGSRVEDINDKDNAPYSPPLSLMAISLPSLQVLCPFSFLRQASNYRGNAKEILEENLRQVAWNSHCAPEAVKQLIVCCIFTPGC